MSRKHLVTGVAGMIGSHIARRLVNDGEEVRGIDNLTAGTLKNIQDIRNDMEFINGDCRDLTTCMRATKGVDYVFTCAADMGGILYISNYFADVVRNNSLINLNMLEACYLLEVEKMFYSSSACIYPNYKQTEAEVVGLKESDAYPADCNEPYGWEKLYNEICCESYRKDYKSQIRIARFHNIMGCAYNAYDSLRGKAPAHSIIKAIKHPNPPFVIWGTGEQTRSFLYIDDCIDGILKLMESDYYEPLNIGSDRLVNMRELSQIAVDLAGKKVDFQYDLTKPVGVMGRNSDNTLVKQVLGWSPKWTLEQGMERLYHFAVEHYDELEGI